MTYRLPSAWDPGYAMPKNAVDEGLERRAFVTKWAPRGSYDNPQISNTPGGYALPKYVQQEAYGQGATVTSWQPSGTYNGPKIPQWLNQRPRITKVVPVGGGAKAVSIRSAAAAALSGFDVGSAVPYAVAAAAAYLLLRKKK